MKFAKVKANPSSVFPRVEQTLKDLPTTHGGKSQTMTFHIFITSIVGLCHLSLSYADSLGSQKISVNFCSDKIKFMWVFMLISDKNSLLSFHAQSLARAYNHSVPINFLFSLGTVGYKLE